MVSTVPPLSCPRPFKMNAPVADHPMDRPPRPIVPAHCTRDGFHHGTGHTANAIVINPASLPITNQALCAVRE